MAELPALLDRLGELRGIGREFVDYRGARHALGTESLRRLLAALGHRVDDPAALAAELESLEQRDWIRVLGPVVVLRGAGEVHFTVLVPLLPTIRWRILTEQGEVLEGEVDPARLAVRGERGVNGLWYRRLALPVPALAPGYHRLELGKDDGSALAGTLLIVAPPRAYLPPALADGGRAWGPSVQLYSLRSARNWGIGDFTDLAGFAVEAAELGADLVGLNPLHALFPADPAQCAPYSPSSRLFLNVLYIDPEALPEFATCIEARRLVGSPEFQARLERLRAVPFVDYPGVASCKLEVLRHLHREFRATADRERGFEFEQFRKKGACDLETYALFHAIQDHFSAAGVAGGWPAWPQPWQQPGGEAARAFGEAEAEAVDFHAWLQWVAAGQLEAAEARARAAGLRLGLYRDLAVGPNGGGAETWGGEDLFARGATVGAPPDPLALQGQDWGIPPYRPDALRESGYAPFIRLLRANMGLDGILRIDHVMMLMRLWWVPVGRPSAEGGYVHYRLDELMAIVALESQRHRCLVIGEDLGTVPAEVRAAMSSWGVFSYRVLMFERDESGRFRAPAEYPREALAAASTHDLPPLASFWGGSDIELRERLGLFPAPGQADEERLARGAARRDLLAALAAEGLAPPGLDAADTVPGPATRSALATAVQCFLARAPAAVLALQPEDWLGMETPVNVPGTHLEYPNWGRKLAADWPDLMARESVWELATMLRRERG